MSQRWVGGAFTRIARKSYSTTFPNSETPILEGEGFVVPPLGGDGTVSNIGNTFVASSPGLGYGTEVAAQNNFLDSVAWLRGSFPANHKITANIRFLGGITGTQECELLLRCSVSPTGRGMFYECNLAKDGAYAGVVQINGDGTFTQGPTVSPGGFADNSTFTAQIVGNVVTTTLNGVQLQQLNLLTTFPNNPLIVRGVPGMGFFLNANGGSTNAKSYCFSSWSAVAL